MGWQECATDSANHYKPQTLHLGTQHTRVQCCWQTDTPSLWVSVPPLSSTIPSPLCPGRIIGGSALLPCRGRLPRRENNLGPDLPNPCLGRSLLQQDVNGVHSGRAEEDTLCLRGCRPCYEYTPRLPKQLLPQLPTDVYQTSTSRQMSSHSQDPGKNKESQENLCSSSLLASERRGTWDQMT